MKDSGLLFRNSKKFFASAYRASDNYYLKFHGKNSLNRKIAESNSSYIISQNKFGVDENILSEIKNFKDYDFFNIKMSPKAELPERFINEVVSLCLNPSLVNDKKAQDHMLPESIARAKSYVPQIKVGAYSCSKGIESVRKRLSERIGQRDNLVTDHDDFYLTYGGMDSYQHILSLFSKDDSILVPSPCHPLYLTMNSCYNLNNEFYSFQNLNSHIPSPQAKAMLVINPSSPTGKVHTLPEMQKIIKYCVENNLVLIASEVLQDLTHKNNSFLSFRSVISSMPYPYNKLEHFAFYSASKNWMFEGSARAGYMKVMNIDPDVRMELYKHISMDICSSVTGQIILDIITSPPSTSDDFGKKYDESLKNSKKYLIKNFNEKIEKLKNFGVFKNVYYPDAGFSLFLEINKDEKLSQGNLPCEYSNIPCCEIFSKMLFEETGVLTTPGTEYGNFPNHVGINFSHEYPNNEEIDKIGKFFYTRQNNFSSSGVKLNNDKFSGSRDGDYVKIKNSSYP